ncbi:hypothetical protein GKE82_24305 [Conexibacter sp. W3-3-2]|uniref:hypothetical protein n=1 Tax=Conexibacter sp. W3-3-2 TaxID=2675227 RepID=UPI0012B7BF5D|nr:hypothetical protein [Conexibacter sp. W3-3-2]MTD47332.1 hypothetical protein [Conexibacter sp. W3-3-2]
MGRMAAKYTIATAITVVGLVSVGSPARAQEADTTAQTIQAVAPEALQGDADATVREDRPVALSVSQEGGKVSVADQPESGVKLDSSTGPAVKVGLPAATKSDDAQAISSSAVAYDSGLSSTVVVAKEDGAQVLATIESAEAPERFRYPLTLAEGQTIQATGDGGYVVLEADGTTIALTIAPPWAKDATGAAVPVRYELDGTDLTMVVEHRSSEATYPIVADPRFAWAWHGVYAYLNRSESKSAVAWGSWAIAFIPASRVVGVVTAIIGAPPIQAMANRAIDRGWCLAVYKSHFRTTPEPFAYRC